MSSQSSNTAKQITESEALGVEEPSMDEILASIKKIISDDEASEANLQDRENYSHPTNPSNSNDMDAELDANLEANLEAAIEMELMEIADSELADNESQDENVSDSAEKGALSQAQNSAESAPKTGDTLEDRAEQIRKQVSNASSGLSADDRLEKYRVRGKLKMEALAERPPVESVAPPAPVVSPAVAAGPVLPTTHTIAQEMANTMLAEKEQEIKTLVANIMRPTIRKWLSENLPVMVEKLVREEIERVSRGKQAS